MKKRFFALAFIFFSFLGYIQKTTCGTALNTTVALGSFGSLIVWGAYTVAAVEHSGMMSVLKSGLIPRLALDGLTTVIMHHVVEKETNTKPDKAPEEKTKFENIMNDLRVQRVSMAISGIGSIASFLYWVGPTMDCIKEFGVMSAVKTTFLLRLGLDVLTVVAVGKNILEN